MANTDRLAEDFLGTLLAFVEEGTEVDEQTVSESILPDFDPTDNWPSLGDIQEFGFGKKAVSSPYMRVLPSGNQIEQQREFVISDWVDFTSRQMQELTWRLQTGLAAKIASGAAQSPNAESDRFIRGWLYAQARRLGAGTDRFRLIWFVELRLVNDIKVGANVIPSALRAYKINELAAESIVFPA